MASSEANPELEHFRRQWHEEVTRRKGGGPTKSTASTRAKQGGSTSSSITTTTTSKNASLPSRFEAPSTRHEIWDEDGDYGTYDFDDMEAREDSKRVGNSAVPLDSITNGDPISALDHYELAVVRETEGKLGESLDLYRRAFRMDDAVDKLYKAKHFPPTLAKAKPVEKQSVPKELKTKGTPKTTSALVASFAGIPITGLAPIIPGDIPPSSPLTKLPTELLIKVVEHVAEADVASLSSLTQSCKGFAYLVTTEESMWRRLVHGTRFGLGGMCYDWAREITGTSLELQMKTLSLERQPYKLGNPLANLPLNKTYPTYRVMYRHRPRIRFSGVYISTVNYTRPGANGANTLSWSVPIHIVTYYRYLRFYRDGSCISLLTTTEPQEVVPYLHYENIGKELTMTTTLPVGVMRDARRGRWKLAPPAELSSKQQQAQPVSTAEDAPEKDPLSHSQAVTSSTAAQESTPTKQLEQPEHEAGEPEADPEGMLTIETEGANKTYRYTARFELKSAHSSSSSATRNTKLVWRGFWSCNVLSGDWAEFGLKNDRAFVWSRVRSWAAA